MTGAPCKRLVQRGHQKGPTRIIWGQAPLFSASLRLCVKISTLSQHSAPDMLRTPDKSCEIRYTIRRGSGWTIPVSGRHVGRPGGTARGGECQRPAYPSCAGALRPPPRAATFCKLARGKMRVSRTKRGLSPNKTGTCLIGIW